MWVNHRHSDMHNIIECSSCNGFCLLCVRTRRNLHSHKEPAPLSRRHYQVSGYGVVRQDFALGLSLALCDHLVGLVVKASASWAEDLGFKSCLRRVFFSGWVISKTKILALQWLPYQVPGSVGSVTGWPGVSVLWKGEMESLICSFYLSVAACKIVWADVSLRYTSMLLGR